MYRQKQAWIWLFVALGLVATVAPAWAHHSFSAEFDGSKTFVVKGVLTKVLWSNPHISFFVDAKDDRGKTVTYQFTSGPPSTLHRFGLKQKDFLVGDQVTVTGCPAKDGSKHLGWLKQIKYSDGHVFVYRDGSE